jgi:hypothetical protein
MNNITITTKAGAKTRDEFEQEVRNLNLRMYRHLIKNVALKDSFISAEYTLNPHPTLTLKVIDTDKGVPHKANCKTMSVSEFKEDMKAIQEQFKRDRQLIRDMESLH